MLSKQNVGKAINPVFIDKGKTVNSLADVLKNLQKEIPVKKKPPHELSATVDEIQKVLKFTHNEKYGYMYWLRKVKGWSYNEIIGILKEIASVDPKYSKGGMLTNKLSNKKKKINK